MVSRFYSVIGFDNFQFALFTFVITIIINGIKCRRLLSLGCRCRSWKRLSSPSQLSVLRRGIGYRCVPVNYSLKAVSVPMGFAGRDDARDGASKCIHCLALLSSRLSGVRAGSTFSHRGERRDISRWRGSVRRCPAVRRFALCGVRNVRWWI